LTEAYLMPPSLVLPPRSQLCNVILKTELYDTHGKVHRCGRPDKHMLGRQANGRRKRALPHKCKRCGREWS
jgi:hypothetical protein